MRTMRVLMTADTVGGVWTYALDLARLLAGHGCEVTLATMGNYLPHADVRSIARTRGIHLHESNFKLEWMDDPWADVAQAGEWLLEIAARTRPDIVHLNNYAHGPLPWGAPVLMVAHSCVLSWWQSVKAEPAPRQWQRYAETVRRGVHAADYVVAPTQAMLDALHRHYGPLPPAQVIHNGRSGRRLARGAKEPFILAVGRLWDEAKNVQALDQAAGDVAWPIYVAGQEHHPDGGQRHFTQVHSLGRLAPSELTGWFARAAIYALPARYEPFGLSVLEAALAGCALVLGDIRSLREVWGDAALYVPPDAPEALAATLNRLTRDPQLRQSLAQAAQQRSRQYSEEAMGRRYRQLYQVLLAGAAPPASPTFVAGPAQVVWPQAAVYQTSTQLGR